MKQLENQLSEFFTKTIPYQLPEHARATIVKAMPWLTLAGGVLSAFGAIGLYQVLMLWNKVDTAANMAYPYMYSQVAHEVSPLLWLSIVLLLAESVVFFMAFPALRAQKKHGWDLLYWASLLTAAYGIVYMFVVYNLGSLLSSLLGSAIGLYLLFQVRGYYIKSAPAKAESAPKKKEE